MAGSVNKVIIVGNLGKDPEMKGSGEKTFATFSVATSERWKDKSSGEQKEKTEWHNVTVFNEQLRKVAEHYLKKGSKVYIEGKLVTRKYEKNGQDAYATSVVLEGFNCTLTMLDSKSDSDNRQPERREDGASSRPASRGHAPAFDGGGMDDDIPF